MTRHEVLKRAPVLAVLAILALWSSEVDAFGLGMGTGSGASRTTTTMGMGNNFGRLFRISTWGESHGGGVGVNLDGCPPKIPLSAQDIQVGACCPLSLSVSSLWYSVSNTAVVVVDAARLLSVLQLQPPWLPHVCVLFSTPTTHSLCVDVSGDGLL